MARKANYDINYFNIIDTEEKAYFLGLICADGYVKKSEYKGKFLYEVSINCKIDDSEILFKLANKLNYGEPKYKEYFDKRKNKIYRNYYIKMSSKKTYDIFMKWFKYEKKLERNFPNISINLKNHFIRGFFDGDGCIRQRKDKVFEIDFSGSKKSLTNINLWLNEDLEIKPMKSIFRIRTNKIAKVEKILKYIYKNSNIFLNRKYQLAEKFASSKTSGKIRES